MKIGGQLGNVIHQGACFLVGYLESTISQALPARTHRPGHFTRSCKSHRPRDVSALGANEATGLPDEKFFFKEHVVLVKRHKTRQFQKLRACKSTNSRSLKDGIVERRFIDCMA